MAPKYEIWTDPTALKTANKQFGIADEVGGIADQYNTHSDLTDIGEHELAAIKAGRFGDTFFGGNLKQQTARANAAAQNDYSLGGSALELGGNSPNAGIIHRRGLDRRMQRNADTAADALSRGMVTYPGVAGAWGQTDNTLLQNKAGLKGLQSGLLSQGWQTQKSGTIYDKHQSVWGKIAKIAAGVGVGLLTGNPMAGIATYGALGGGGSPSILGDKMDGGLGGGYGEGEYDNPITRWFRGLGRKKEKPTLQNSNVFMDSTMPNIGGDDPFNVLGGLGDFGDYNV